MALAAGRRAELPTGEGKKLAAVPGSVWLARERKGVHVLTADDYFARHDAQWMQPIYQHLGLTAGVILQGMAPARRHAQDVTYAAATKVGFGFPRAGRSQSGRGITKAFLRRRAHADSILIDEARIPLVIAADSNDGSLLAHGLSQLATAFRPGLHYLTDEGRRHVNLTDNGVRVAEHAFGCGNLCEPAHLALYTALQDGLHTHLLLRSDVDSLTAWRAAWTLTKDCWQTAIRRGATTWTAGVT